LVISVKSNSLEKQYSIEEQKQEVSIQELKELNEWRENKHLKDFMLQDKESLVISLKQEKEKFESDLVQCQHDLAQVISDGLRRKVAMHEHNNSMFISLQASIENMKTLQTELNSCLEETSMSLQKSEESIQEANRKLYMAAKSGDERVLALEGALKETGDSLREQKKISEQQALDLEELAADRDALRQNIDALTKHSREAYEELRSSFHGLQEQDLEKQGTIKDLRADLEVLRQELDFVKNILDSNQTIHI
jgi:DNA repair exonuclease SbcCD ATPase subunit